MIKLSKKTNNFFLEVFHRKIILLIFKWLKNSTTPVTTISSFKNLTIYRQEEKDILKIIFRKKNLKNHLNNILTTFNASTDKDKELKKITRLYKHQRKKLQQGNYNITPVKVDSNVKELFTIFFFEKLFSDKNFWTSINIPSFSKEIFKKNFNIKVCPYCNTEKMFDVRNYKVDHFLPKSSFPLLSMYHLNLIPICESCNSSDKGKGSKFRTPISSQFYKEIGLDINFFNDLNKKTIVLTSSSQEANEFIALLQLKKKYESQLIFEDVNQKLKSLHSNISRFSVSDPLAYLNYQIEDLKLDSLFYAKKEIFSDFIKKNYIK